MGGDEVEAEMKIDHSRSIKLKEVVDGVKMGQNVIRGDGGMEVGGVGEVVVEGKEADEGVVEEVEVGEVGGAGGSRW